MQWDEREPEETNRTKIPRPDLQDEGQRLASRFVVERHRRASTQR